MANIYLAHYFSATTRNDTASVTPIANDPLQPIPHCTKAIDH